MVSSVKKRSGKTVKFNVEKIRTAITKANRDVKQSDPTAKTLTKEQIDFVTKNVVFDLVSKGESVDIEQIQDAVEKVIMSCGYYDVAKSYILYREKHRIRRDASLHLMEQCKDYLFSEAKDDNSKRENANINGDASMGIMLKLGAEVAKTYAKYFSMPDEFTKMHVENYVHIHDLDFSQICWNCCQIDMLKLAHDGFSTGHGHIREPNSVRSYAALGCVAIQSNQCDMLGGQFWPRNPVNLEI